MKKRVVAILLALILVTCVAVAAVGCNDKSDLDYVLDKGTLVCGITLYAPMNYFNDDGDLIGFDTEFANAVGEKLGVSVKFQIIAWDSKYMELNSKSIDAIWNGFTIDDERKEQVEFSTPYLNNTQCVVVKASNLAQYTSEAALAGKKGVAETASAGESEAQRLVGANGTYTAASVQTSALMEVKSGTADFAVVDQILANSMVGKGDYADLAVVTAIPLEEEVYGIGFRKGSDLAAKVNEIIAQLIADGTLRTIAEKYGVENALVVG